jgi:cystathionine gamma-synthase
MIDHAPETIAARHGAASDPAWRAVTPPLHLSTTFAHDGWGGKGRFDYARTGNPTRATLEEALAALEGGAGAVVTASGMAAINLAFAPLPAGSRVIAPHDCYGGTWRLLDAHARMGRLVVRFIDLADPAALAAALAEPTAMVVIETPSNPLMRVYDIAAITCQVHAAGARVMVDNTFLSPARQLPLALGADLVAHSTTKFLNGHSDVIGGVLVAATAEAHTELAWWANCTGVGGAPFDSYQTLRGLRTLFVRMERAEAGAARIAAMLAAHPAVAAVHWPGLANHPGHALARRQQSGFGAVLSFELRGGLAAARAVINAVRLLIPAQSLGGVETLISHPATMTHAGMAADARAAAGITGGLLRMSVGLEAPEDLERDLAHALVGL